MLLTLFFAIIKAILNTFILVLPEYDSFPFPADFLTALNSIFSTSATFIQLPFIRVFADFISTWWIPLLLILILKNYVLDIINFIRGSGKIK